jgi:hypothetical protein
MQLNENLMKKKELDKEDKLDSIAISKTMNLEKNLPLVILEVELGFEIKNVTVEIETDNLLDSQKTGKKAFDYLFYDSIVNSSQKEINQDKLQNVMGSLLVRDTYSNLFTQNFKKNEYLGRFLNQKI